MIKNTLIILVLSVIFISIYFNCNNSNKYEAIKYSKYKSGNLIAETKGFKQDSIIDRYSKLIRYYTEDTSLSFFIKVNEINDSSVLYNGKYIPKQKEKLFSYNEESVRIIKYEYDMPNSQDEETYIFVNSKYEIVCINYYVWGLSVFIETQGASDLYKKILLDKRNRQFLYFVPK